MPTFTRLLSCSRISNHHFLAGLLRSFVLSLCLVLPVVSYSSAALRVQSITASGTITDSSGAVVPDATVEVLVGGRAATTILTTGSDGRYSVELPAGAQALRIRREGFSEETIVLAEGTVNLTRNVVLRIAPVASQIVVTASRTERNIANVSGAVSVFTDEDIAVSGSRQLSDIVNQVPGLSVEATGREGSLASLFSRGGESDYNLVLLDGVRVNDNGGSFDFSKIAASEIERVEVVRGAQSALYGSDAIGSIINLTTKRAAATDPPMVVGNLEGGSFDTFRGDLRLAGGVGDRFDYSSGISYRGSEGGFAELLPENDRLDQTAYDLGLGALIGDTATIRSNLRYSNKRGKAIGQIAYGSRDTGTMANARDLSWSIGFSQRLNTQFSHSLSFDYFDSELDSEDNIGDPSFDLFAILEGENGAIFPDSPRLVDLIGQARFDGIVAGGEVLPAGQFVASATVFDFPFASRTQLKRPAFKYQADLNWGGDQTLSGGYEFERESNPMSDFRVTNNAFFIQQQFSVDRRWFLTVGGRVDENSDFGTSFNPKASVGAYLRPFTFGALSSVKVFFNIGRGIKFPDFGALFGSAFTNGNPDLTPERARTLDGGVEITLSDQRARIGVTYFDNRFRDQVGFSFSAGGGSDGVPDFDQVDGSKARGWEFEAALQRPVSGFTANAWYAIVDTEVTENLSSAEQFQSGQPLLRRPKHSAMFQAAQSLDRVTLNFDVRYVGRRHDSSFLFMSTPANQPAEIRVNPGYTVVGAGAELQVGERTAVHIRGDNLGGTTYESALGYPGLSRSFVAGLRFALSLVD